MIKEIIKKDEWGAFIKCICGNTEFTNGFYACDKKGNEVEPDMKWNGKLYVCGECGRIVNQFSGEVVGKAVKGAVRL